MAPLTSSAATTTSVQVALRIRPTTTQDSNSIPVRFQRSVIQTTSSTSVSVDAPSNSLAGAGAPSAPTYSGSSVSKKQAFTFDQVHGPSTSQYELFEATAKPMITRFIDGFNCTVLAYGQTSSGKTFTMTGVDLDADPSDPNTGMGIIPRAVSTIFSRAKQLKEERGGAWIYTIKGSFIEIYNEDLLDLLSADDATGFKREVQIREDKEGHIIWGGLREISVKNVTEVMSLIRQGTSIRRTNETDMNAQSSRSHAIFSLTLTQKKCAGTMPPSPLPHTGRSPSRLARPGSMYAGPNNSMRVTSPTLGRPGTPSFASAVARGALRPSSALGHTGERLLHDEESGEWTTIISKFHFVDLAGSERLKRTAAIGERIKEGISINSGLLALGNVISALGDPSRAKSNTNTHIPYRDSKLTRLLQDSLGGNAHTLMIACVSPAEWNAGETINTLKYANRARNIKNRVVVNEKEDGWDDIEWLQNTVTRLRREMKSLKEGRFPTEAEKDSEIPEGAGKRVLAQFTELQNKYEDLREKYVERSEELGRLRGELGERQRLGMNGNTPGTAKYEEIVGPVIEEYEKAITTMEAELSLNRAALRHTNELVEEKEEELASLTSRHTATELYVEKLRSRVSKLTEREASTEAYVHDLEEKIKAYDETSTSSSESLGDLKRELSRFKDQEVYSAKYIVDLEVRLSKSDESILSLQQSVEQLEQECDKRRGEVDALQFKLDALQQDGDGWRADLEKRETRVLELEQKMAQWEQKKKDAEETRIRLENVVEEVATTKDLESPSSSPSSSPTSTDAPTNELTAEITPQGTTSVVTSQPEQGMTPQYLALQQTHTATLADLSAISSKYRDALREISDLAAQLDEVKLGSPTIAEEEPTAELTAVERPESLQIRRRNMNGRHREDIQVNAAGRRLFFRQAASAESLHSRSLSQSVSLSQELSSVHWRRVSSSSHANSLHSPSSSHSLYPSSRLTLSDSLVPTTSGQDRIISSLEKEIMRLQEVLKERETEIHDLEKSFAKTQVTQVVTQEKTAVAVPLEDQITVCNRDVLSPKTLDHFDHIKQSMANGVAHTIHSDHGSNHSESDESLERLNELMLSMAQKESQHREVVEELNAELAQTKRQLDELTALSRDQALNMSQELEALQKKYICNLDELKDHQDLLEEASYHKLTLENQLHQAEENYKEEFEHLRREHKAAIMAKETEVEESLGRMGKEHESALYSLQSELKAAAAAALGQARSDHEESSQKLRADHDKELRHQIEEANEILSNTRAEHQKIVNKLISDHAEAIRQKEVEASAASQTTEEEYYNALTKLRVDHAEAISKLKNEASATVERLREEHAGELRMAEIARQGSLSESETFRNNTMKELQEEHAAAFARKDMSYAEDIEALKDSHARMLQAKEDDLRLQMDRLRLESEQLNLKLREEWRKEVVSLSSSLSNQKEQADTALSKANKHSDAILQGVRERHATTLQEMEWGHEQDVKKLKVEHQQELKDAQLRAEDELNLLRRTHEEMYYQLSTNYDQKHAALQADAAAIQQQHQKALEDMQKESQQALVVHEDAVNALQSLNATEQEKMRTLLENEYTEALRAQLSELEHKHVSEKRVLQKDQDLLLQEPQASKVAAEESAKLYNETSRRHEKLMTEKTNELQKQMLIVTSERDGLTAEVAKLKQELEKNRSEQTKLVQEVSRRESLASELERHRSHIADLKESWQKVKDEKDNLQSEKSRQDNLVRDLQAQIARSASPPNVRSSDRPIGYSRAAGLPPSKLPPPTPPPSVPPPPPPRLMTHINGDSNLSTSSHTSSNMTISSSKESQPDSPATSLGHLLPNVQPIPDSKLTAKIEQQSKQIEEQETIIKTLNKQLTHCESDLQAHMDLVSTLEASLGDSEKNLRKARVQATELARERDTLTSRIESLRNELSEAKYEVANVRQSIVEEKQSLEQRLEEEKKAKERVRQQLDQRMEELQKRKSKFACL